MVISKKTMEILVFDSSKLRSTELHSTNENKEVLQKYAELWDGIKNETEQ